MEIKKREVLFSVIIVFLMLFLGIWLSGAITRNAARTAEQYITATIITEPSQFQYGMRTNFGNALVYGTLSTESPVTFDEIDGEYICAVQVKERYQRHTRTVTTTDSKGKTHTKTEVYYSWDRVGSITQHTDTISFLGAEFPYETISAPTQRHPSGYHYHGASVRYYYEVTPLDIDGTIFATLQDNTIKPTELNKDKTPEEVIASRIRAIRTYQIVFWIIWIVIIGGAVFGFLYAENYWLD